MRRGDFKAVLVPKPYGTGKWRLHDLEKNPGEANNLSKQTPNELKTLIAAWDKYAKDVVVVPPK